MLAVTMICASIGLTAFAATTTTVEAEADGVSAYTLPSSDKSNSKILKNTVSSKESVTYYIQANNTPRATMFKLAQVNTGDKINVDINFTYLDRVISWEIHSKNLQRVFDFAKGKNVF